MQKNLLKELKKKEEKKKIFSKKNKLIKYLMSNKDLLDNIKKT